MSLIYILCLLQVIIIMYNIILYHSKVLHNSNRHNEKKIYLNNNEFPDEWGQFVNIEMI